ncbi:SAC3 family protein C [Malus sylvestris]|uniref:SAC3 family protein C n=1 Tax=Malus sylvestris TaxID=3752 RepID=UPI0021ACAB47|nr:SAC3 family protein C [Malus sylvestris]
MERRGRGRNVSSSQSTRGRSNRFVSKPTSAATPKSSSGGATGAEKAQKDAVDNHSDVPAIVGTCPLMCPEGERAQRERLRDLAVFERLHGNPRQSSPDLAVKKFFRTTSNKQVEASDVRPLPVLEDTLNYLLNLFDSREYPVEVVHDFLFDRTRSIRQDLSMQNVVNDKVIHMYEKMVKFHIISLRKLRGCRSQNTSSTHYLNMEQLAKTLTSLFDLYEAHRHSNSTYENEAEFCSFYVLLHLGPNTQPMGESLSWWFSHLPSLLIKSKEMCFSRKILRFFRMGNYKCFLSTIAAEASYLQYCILEPYINQVRALAVLCINNGGYRLHPYPLAHLSKLLMMTESDLESLCRACGLDICTDEDGRNLLPTKQTTFCHPKDGFQSYRVLGLEEFER